MIWRERESRREEGDKIDEQDGDRIVARTVREDFNEFSQSLRRFSRTLNFYRRSNH